MLVVVGIAATMAAVAAPPASATPTVDASSIDSVRSAYARYQAFQQVPSGWAGSAADCTADTQSDDYLKSALGQVNIMRGLAGLEPVTLNAIYNAQAQRAALMMDAAGRLEHHPDSDWPCWSTDGADAAARSNLSADPADGDHVRSFMDDHGAANEAVGHRRWILYPPTRTIGVGATDTHEALLVISDDLTNAPGPTWVGWPSAGHFPQQLLPTLSRRWSLSANDTSTDFSRATVAVRGPTGALTVKTLRPHPGYGNAALVWSMPELPRVTGGGAVTYTVTVGNIVKDGKRLSHTYPVKLIDGDWVNVYTTPGTHHVNERDWRTTCSMYSSSVERCRTDIWATTATGSGDRWVQSRGWVFNNLTYKTSPRNQWRGNPLGTPGTHTINGRRWRTQCDNAWTGRGACRSEIWATVVVHENGTYRYRTMWVFNNIVNFG